MRNLMRPDTPFYAPVKSGLTDQQTVYVAGNIPPGWQAPRGSVVRSGPRRLAVYSQNWSGERQWQTWCSLDYPPYLRPQIQGQNAQAFALSTLKRVQNAGTQPRPIPLQDYSLQTRMTVVGTIGPDGRIVQ